MYCRYRHNNHPHLILRPIKEEQLLDQPIIYLFHDVLTDSEIEEIKSLASPRVCHTEIEYKIDGRCPLNEILILQLQRAVVRDLTTNTFKPADYRICKRYTKDIFIVVVVYINHRLYIIFELFFMKLLVIYE